MSFSGNRERPNSTFPTRTSIDRIKPNIKTELHCLGDVCIRVRVPSSSILSRISAMNSAKTSDASLEAYAKQVAENIGGPTLQGSRNYFKLSDFYDKQYGYFDKDDTAEDNPDNVTGSNLGIMPKVDCLEFLGPVVFAKEFVENVVSESEAKIELIAPFKEVEEENINESSGFMEGFRESTGFSYIDTKRSFTSWPTIESFDVEGGAYKIDEYLSSFETDEDWMYVIYYHGMQETICSNLYKYQAIYSLPTWRYPIAQATASIYFTIEVCKVKPGHCLVDVTYRYETFRHVRKPGVLDFQERWLHHILDSKIKFFKTITY